MQEGPADFTFRGCPFPWNSPEANPARKPTPGNLERETPGACADVGEPVPKQLLVATSN